MSDGDGDDVKILSSPNSADHALRVRDARTPSSRGLVHACCRQIRLVPFCIDAAVLDQPTDGGLFVGLLLLLLLLLPSHRFSCGWHTHVPYACIKIHKFSVDVAVKFAAVFFNALFDRNGFIFFFCSFSFFIRGGELK